MNKQTDIDALVAASSFREVDEFALYVARNPGMPMKTLARRAEVEVADVQRLLTSRPFRERVTELMTYHELSPDRERAVLKRMIDVATAPTSDFRDFREAASWVFRQGGMLRGEKTQVETDTTIRVALVLDEPDSLPKAQDVGGYVAPDPLAGVVGLPAPGESDVIDAKFVRHGAGVPARGKVEEDGEAEDGPRTPPGER